MTISALVLVATSTLAMAADVNVGTWKMDPAKSKFSPGPALKSQTLKIVSSGANGVHYTMDGVTADGKPTHWDFNAQYDGKYVPFTGNPDADMISYKHVDANTIESNTQLKGKDSLKAKVVFSMDGKTRTLTQTGKNAQGKDVNNVVVYDRQ
jgi:hypothetical protein